MPPTVLLTNDDGPPHQRDSPYILGLFVHLTRNLGWNVKVVIPDSQKSWIGKAHHIRQTVSGKYYYPRADGQGTTSVQPRPLQDGELAEWILLDATPATCANVGLHNLYPNEIDLVISGPNLGRNSSAAFALSSGTIGAAMSSSLSRIRSIALSYGTVLHPTPTNWFDPAHVLGVRIIDYLWTNWGKDPGGLRNGEIDLYNINIPLIENLLSNDGLPICWTTMWRNSYSQLFKTNPPAVAQIATGPDSLDSQEPEMAQTETNSLSFRWAPQMKDLINPDITSLPSHSDGWALHQGWVSITPLRASFGEPEFALENRILKL